MHCLKCGTESPEGKKFCGDCGSELVERPAAAEGPGEPGVYFCGKHKKETTRVRCGRCEIPICTRCAVYGPVGVRCRDCARNKVPLRPMGVLHSAGRGLEENGPRLVWYAVIWAMVVGVFRDLFGGPDS